MGFAWGQGRQNAEIPVKNGRHLEGDWLLSGRYASSIGIVNFNKPTNLSEAKIWVNE